MTSQAETGVMRVLAEGYKDPRPPPEARKRQGKIHPEPRREHGPADTDLRLLASTSVRQYISVVLSHTLCGYNRPGH